LARGSEEMAVFRRRLATGLKTVLWSPEHRLDVIERAGACHPSMVVLGTLPAFVSERLVLPAYDQGFPDLRHRGTAFLGIVNQQVEIVRVVAEHPEP
jgi:hypothetical protein